MPYAQKNYLAVQGVNGKYRIDQIGCLLTAICNILERSGRPVSPLEANAWFRDTSNYIDVDDGVRDDLGFHSLSVIEPRITIKRQVVKGINDRTAGWPSSRDAIIRFNASRFGTHFAIAVDPANKIILDSWDGQVKQNPYGEPTAWCEYELSRMVPVTPVQSAVMNAIAPVKPGHYRIQPGEGLSHAAKALGWPDFDQEARWNYIAHNLNGYDNWQHMQSQMQPGWEINVGNYTPPPPAPTLPPQIPAIQTTTDIVTEAKPATAALFGDFRDTYKPGERTDKAFREADIYDELTGDLVGKIVAGQPYKSDGIFIKEKDGKLVTFLRRKYKQYEWVGVPGSVLKPFNDELRDNDDLDDDLFAHIDMDDGETIIPHMTDEQRKQARREKRLKFVGNILGFATSIVTVLKKKREQ